MFWRSSGVALLCVFVLVSCIRVIPKEDIYPFSQAKRIEVLSYPSRMSWDEKPDRKIVEDGKIRIDTRYIKERVVLEEAVTEKLYSYLFIEECPMINIVRSLCYEPRHAVLFYNEAGKAYAYIEVCLECGTSEGDFLHNDICDDRTADLEQIFRDAGIKYFGQE